MNWLNKLDAVLNQGKNSEEQRDGDGGEDSETSLVGESSDLQEEVPHEQLFVNASKPTDPSMNTQALTSNSNSRSPSRPQKYPGVVRRTPVASRQRASEESSNDVVAKMESHTNASPLRESQTLQRQPMAASSAEVANGVDASNGGLEPGVETSDGSTGIGNSGEEKDETQLERHIVAASTPVSPLSRNHPSRYPGAVRRTPILRRRQTSDENEDEDMDSDSNESGEPIELQLLNSRSQTNDTDTETPSIVDTSKDTDQAPNAHYSGGPGLSTEAPPQTDSHAAPIHNSRFEASTDKSADTDHSIVQADNIETLPSTSMRTEDIVKDDPLVDHWGFQDADLSDATTPAPTSMMGPITEPNTKDMPNTLTEIRVQNSREEGLSHDATEATGLDATSTNTLVEGSPSEEGLSHEAIAANESPSEEGLSHEAIAANDLSVPSPKTLAEAQLDTARDDGFSHQATAATGLDATSVEAIVSEAAQTGDVEYPKDGEDEQVEVITPADFIPQNVEFRSDFEVDRLLASWEDDLDGTTPFESRLNCYGIVHVRILRAQRLPCSVGSAVQAVVSLKPWKGRIRTEKARTFSGQPTSSGVCAQWDEDESSPISMVHAYSSEESPVPSIHVALVFNPLGVFEFTMCYLTLSCRSLMRDPLVPKRQWLVTQLQEENGENLSAVDDRIPLIQIEATFEPANSIDLGLPDPADELDAESTVSVDRALVEEDSSRPTASVASSPKVQLEEPSRSDVSFSLDSRRKGQTKAVPSKPHMLRLIKFWTPANCCVCNQSITSGLWTKKAYHCEECGVDCCSDCQLHVDIQLPCGSDLARRAVEKSSQKTFTLSNILHFVAPVDESLKGKLQEEAALPSAPSVSKGGNTIVASSSRIDEEGRGIGTLKLNFVQAHLFEDHLPAETEHSSVIDREGARFRSGDYYIRVAWTGTQKTARTRTIQGTGRPRFEAGEMCFNVPHYGTEFRIEVVDGATDKPVGVTLLTTQSLLQEQRDYLIEQGDMPLLRFRKGPISFEGKRRLVLELRTGLKTGFGSDFFEAAKGPSTSGPGPGDIVGCLEVFVGLEEDIDSLYGKIPIECPPPPPDELNMNMFQLHLARIFSLIDDFNKAVETYLYVVSWDNPTLTSLSLMLFIFFCFRFDPAYFGSVPVFFLIVFMVYLAIVRTQGHPKSRFIRKEIDAERKAEKVAVNYTLHRPVGLVSVGVLRGRNIRSPELGLPGNVGCRVYWDPTRYATEKRKKAAVALDKSAAATHDIGSTNFLYAMNPVWNQMTESAGAKRLQLLLPNGGDFFDTARRETQKEAIEFPILQPFEASNALPALVPWTSSCGALVVEVKFHDVLNILPGSDYAVGEVSIPFSRLAKAGSLEGWFHVLDVGTTRILPASTQEGNQGPSLDSGARKAKEAPINLTIDESPQIFLRINLTAPEQSDERIDNEMILESQREASFVIQEEMVRSAVMSQQQKFDVVGSSIGAFNRFRGLSGNLLLVQNTLGLILDTFEAFRNAFNFSDPYKSSVLFAGLVVIWFFLVLVPTRVIVLIGGLAQFGYTFFVRFGRPKGTRTDKTPKKEVSSTEDRAPASPVMTWIMNAIRGLPTDEDLRKTYFWESRRRGALEKNIHAEEKRKSRLRRLWRAQWYSSAHILRPNEEGQDLHWEIVFCMIQGHRFLWWRSPEDFDNGEAPLGRIFLAGHAGLATPSPLDMRSIRKDELLRTVCIFGRGEDKQERVTILTPTVDVKNTLEDAIVSATTSKAD